MVDVQPREGGRLGRWPDRRAGDNCRHAGDKRADQREKKECTPHQSGFGLGSRKSCVSARSAVRSSPAPAAATRTTHRSHSASQAVDVAGAPCPQQYAYAARPSGGTAYTVDSKSIVRKDMRVQIPPRALRTCIREQFCACEPHCCSRKEELGRGGGRRGVRRRRGRGGRRAALVGAVGGRRGGSRGRAIVACGAAVAVVGRALVLIGAVGTTRP